MRSVSILTLNAAVNVTLNEKVEKIVREALEEYLQKKQDLSEEEFEDWLKRNSKKPHPFKKY